MFSALNMINNMLNNMLFLFISVIIDVGLIRFTKQNLARKRRLCAENDIVKHAIMLKEKITKLIITNGLLYFLSHMSEFADSILLLGKSQPNEWFICFAVINAVTVIQIIERITFCVHIYFIYS